VKCVNSVILWFLLAIVCLAFTFQMIMCQMSEVQILTMTLLEEVDILQV